MITEDCNAADGTKSMPDKRTGKTMFLLKGLVPAAPATAAPKAKPKSIKDSHAQGSRGLPANQVKPN